MTLREQLHNLYNEKTNYQFIARSRTWLYASIAMIAISVGALFIFGLNQSIEFTGGTSFETVVNGKTPDPGEIRDLLIAEGISEMKVQIVNNDSLRITSERLDSEQQTNAIKVISDYAEVDPNEISISDVGPSWGSQVSRQALIALAAFLVIVSIYMIFRFEFAMSIAAIIAVIHDLIITVGVYAIFQFTVSPATVIAVLTLLGFSLYDSVVVFDKVKDNTVIWEKLRQGSYADMVNTSLNQVLMRSINTAITSSLPVISLILVGSLYLNAVALMDFAVALLVGLIAGTYSSIFVATPLLVTIKRWTKKADNM